MRGLIQRAPAERLWLTARRARRAAGEGRQTRGFKEVSAISRSPEDKQIAQFPCGTVGEGGGRGGGNAGRRRQRTTEIDRLLELPPSDRLHTRALLPVRFGIRMMGEGAPSRRTAGLPRKRPHSRHRGATSRALRSPEPAAFQGNPCSLNRPRSAARSLRRAPSKLAKLRRQVSCACRWRHTHAIVEPSTGCHTRRRVQRPHDRNHPFASMHRLSNSPRLASAFSASVPAATTAFVASN